MRGGRAELKPRSEGGYEGIRDADVPLLAVADNQPRPPVDLVGGGARPGLHRRVPRQVQDALQAPVRDDRAGGVVVLDGPAEVRARSPRVEQLRRRRKVFLRAPDRHVGVGPVKEAVLVVDGPRHPPRDVVALAEAGLALAYPVPVDGRGHFGQGQPPGLRRGLRRVGVREERRRLVPGNYEEQDALQGLDRVEGSPPEERAPDAEAPLVQGVQSLRVPHHPGLEHRPECLDP
mmetsp:Transcript_6221/g.17539  ORF Transcript_6221/g.17539 Transcript_6221/m.17539 type:complete len:233 (+) Transcript_6221:310-1008(+)